MASQVFIPLERGRGLLRTIQDIRNLFECWKRTKVSIQYRGGCSIRNFSVQAADALAPNCMFVAIDAKRVRPWARPGRFGKSHPRGPVPTGLGRLLWQRKWRTWAPARYC